MAWPDDYYLPAKGILDDTPVDPDTIEYYKIQRLQVEGLRLMLNERIAVLSGSTLPAWDTHVKRSTQLTTLASSLNTYCKFFVDTEKFPDGDFDDVSGINFDRGKAYKDGWTLSSLLNAAGVGVTSGSTTGPTRVPSRNPFGLSASSYGSLSNYPAYKEQINDLYYAIKKLTHPMFEPTLRHPDGGTGTFQRYGYGTTKAIAEYNYDNGIDPYIGIFVPRKASGWTTGTYGDASLLTNLGRLYWDFSTTDGVSMSIYAGCTGSGDLSPPYTCNDKYALIDTVTGGSTYLTDSYGEDTRPTWGSAGSAIGWSVWGRAVCAPSWEYP